MKSLFPIFQDDNRSLMQLQTVWAQVLNRFFSNPLANEPSIISQAVLTGANTINHKLGRPLIGCLVILQDATATFFQAETSTPNINFILNASAPCNVSLYLF